MASQLVDNFEEESILINPEDLKRRRQQKVIENVESEKAAIIETKDQFNKVANRGGQVTVNYETEGRFDMPKTLYFKDFTVSHVSDLTLSSQENLLENLVSIIQQIKNEDAEISVEDMLWEEFLETLIGIKMEFNTPIHMHPWVCDCQSGIPIDAQKINESAIDLRTIKYKSISEVDEEMKIYLKGKFDEMSEEDFVHYLKRKYNEDPNIVYQKNEDTINKEIQKVQVKEPITLFDDNWNSYSFRFTRIKDLMNAQKLVDNKYSGKIRAVKNRQIIGNESLLDARSHKEKEINDIKTQQAKDIMIYSKAFSLVKYNGKDLTPDEAIKYYKDASRSIFMQMSEVIDKLHFGIYDERELVCPLCGETSKRLLRKELNPFELLPLDLDTERDQRKHSKSIVYFGI